MPRTQQSNEPKQTQNDGQHANGLFSLKVNVLGMDIFLATDRVENLRTVTTDGVSQRKAIDRVYAQIASGSAAQTFISEFYRGDPPFKRAETETVSVEVKSVLPTSDRTYEVEWLETTRDLYGTVKATDRWKGYFAIALNPPKDERQARINPLGVYITNASWAKVL
jgi:type IV secretory pathway TrbF-like protein